MIRKLCLSLLGALTFTLVHAQAPSLTHTLFASGFNRPVDIAHCGDDRIFVVQQRGKIRIMDQNGSIFPSDFLDIDSRVINSGNERGLLGLAFHPEYKQNGYFYVYYSNNSGNSVVARYEVNPLDSNQALVNSEQILLTFSQPYSNHNGGCIKFGPDGYLYIASGDGGSAGDPQANGQKPNTFLGKMLRIDVDNGSPYGIPQDNPFVSNASFFPEIWAYGLRNPWRFSFDRITGDMWIGDVGQNNWEEIDFQPGSSAGGENYGWRCYEANATYNTSGCAGSGFTAPVFEYVNNFSFGCSVTGGFVYRGGVHNALYGYYIHADYCSGRFWITWPTGGGNFSTTDLGTQSGDPATFGEDAWGELYWADLGGSIYKIGTSGCAPTAAISGMESFCQGDSTVLSTPYNPDLVYQWYLNGNPIAGATGNSITTSATGNYSVEVTNSSQCSTLSDSVTVTEDQQPTATLGGLLTNYCTDDGPVTLSGSPSGGTFSGTGVTDSIFDPSAAGPGQHLITYTFYQGACVAQDTQTVVVDICQALSPGQASEAVEIAPNPSKGAFEIIIHSARKQELALTIVSVKGEKIWEKGFSTYEKGESRLEVQLQNAASGIYLLRIKDTQNGSQVRKIVIED